MIDPTDLSSLRAMQAKYQDSATAIAQEKAKALANVEDRYRRALNELEEQRKAKIAAIEKQSQADGTRIGQFLGQLNAVLSNFGAEPSLPTDTVTPR